MSINFIIFLIIIFIQGMVFIYGFIRSTARRRLMVKLALELGLEYKKNTGFLLGKVYRLESLERGQGSDCAGYVYADTGDRQMYLFDLLFQKSEDQPKSITTAIVWEDVQLDLPPFLIQPRGYKGFFSSLGPSVSLEDRYEIHNRFKMNCPSEKFARAFFDTAVIDHFSQNKDLVLEYVDGLFCLQLKRKAIPASRINELMAIGYKLLSKAEKLSGGFQDWKEEEEEKLESDGIDFEI